jgi:hypothetical protein
MNTAMKGGLGTKEHPFQATVFMGPGLGLTAKPG